MDTLTNLMTAEWLGLVSLIVTILAIPAGSMFSDAFKTKIRLSYITTFSKIYNANSREHINVTVNSESTEITNLSMSELYLWNSGTKDIKLNYFTENAAIFKFDALFIKIFTVSYAKSDTLKKVPIEIKDTEILLKPDLIEPGEGIYLKILHSAYQDCLKPENRLFDMQKPKKISFTNIYEIDEKINPAITWFTRFLIAIFLAFTLYYLYNIANIATALIGTSLYAALLMLYYSGIKLVFSKIKSKKIIALNEKQLDNIKFEGSIISSTRKIKQKHVLKPIK